MSARAVRRLVLATCALGVAGMIATQIAEANDATVAIGLVTSTAVLVLLAVTAVSARRDGPPRVDEAQAVDLEGRVRALLDAGAPEDQVRAVVQAAIRLGRDSV